MRSTVRRLLLAFCLASAVATLESAARCEVAHAPEWGDRRLVLEGILGLGTPVGSAGVMARVEPAPWLSIGGGMGASPFNGTAWGAMALFRVPLLRGSTFLSAFTLDTGYSAGASHAFNPNPTWCLEDCTRRWTHVVHRVPSAEWVHLQAGIEGRLEPSGIYIRGFTGFATGLNPNSGTCTLHNQQTHIEDPVPCDDLSFGERTVFVLGFALGYAFPL